MAVTGLAQLQAGRRALKAIPPFEYPWLWHSIGSEALTLVVSVLLPAATGVAILSAVAGIRLAGQGVPSQRLITFSAGLLVGLSLFGVLPELGQAHGVAGGIALLASGFACLWAIDRYLYPVCPACSYTHDHGNCSVMLHGFAPPLVMAAACHSLLDGLGIEAALTRAASTVSLALPLAVALHKVPEGLALGSILRAAVRTRAAALLLVLAAELPTLAGGVLQAYLQLHGGALWTSLVLSLAGGSFLFLGYHALLAEWKRGGLTAAVLSGLSGAAGAAALQQGIRVFLR